MNLELIKRKDNSMWTPDDPLLFEKMYTKIGPYKISEILDIPVGKIKGYAKRQNLKYTQKRFSPDKKLFTKLYTEEGAVATSRYFEVTLAIVLNYAKRHNIQQSTSYAGTKKKIPNEEQFRKDHQSNLTLNQLSKKYNVARSVIRRWEKDLNLERKLTKFDKWKIEYDKILSGINEYVDKNKNGMTLLDISSEENISIEQLKKAFKETENTVVLHSYNKSKGELEVKNYINSLGFECISTKKTFENKQYEIDCFVPELNFGVEYCGEFWHSEENLSRLYHRDKFIWCKKQNLTLMTIFENEWKLKSNIVKSMIRHKLGISDKLYARNTKFVEIDSNTAKEFHDENHIHGGIYSSKNYGLMCNNELISVISFMKSRFHKEKDLYEISRFSSKLNMSVIGGFSKLLKNCNINNIVTFADLRFGDGTVYEKNGFKFQEITPPNYWYYHKSGGKLHSRFAFQKHKLKDKLEVFDENLSESENMKNNGWLKVYDCGSYKYLLDK